MNVKKLPVKKKKKEGHFHKLKKKNERKKEIRKLWCQVAFHVMIFLLTEDDLSKA